MSTVKSRKSLVKQVVNFSHICRPGDNTLYLLHYYQIDYYCCTYPLPQFTLVQPPRLSLKPHSNCPVPRMLDHTPLPASICCLKKLSKSKIPQTSLKEYSNLRKEVSTSRAKANCPMLPGYEMDILPSKLRTIKILMVHLRVWLQLHQTYNNISEC